MEANQNDTTQSEAEELESRIRLQVANWQSVSRGSRDTRIDFQYKLAVLCAGSITIVASGTVAILSLRTSHPQIAPHSFPCIAAASLFLLFALSCSIIHNYMETVIQEKESKSNMLASLVSMYELAKGQRHVAEAKKALSIIGNQLEENANRSAKSSLTGRRVQQYVSSAAVIFLLIGYVAVVCLIWIEASTLSQ
ncbi:MAG: hypothetical protein JWQ42_926 [Edaphobacter sp.]|nr:hypothetical protein [Edaphobacter sp.]